ncbi:MAG: class I SAM-dependent methyltransferase [Burkholderiaceae bacterium]|nr:class I SAM-dependent methyltransferase [Burkholderiaceae bacterium]
MTRNSSIIELAQWLQSPPGRYLLEWEQRQLDHAVADVFGFHALQLGLPDLAALRANRMPHRWVAGDSLREPELLALPPVDEDMATLLPIGAGVALHCDFDALPFPSNSLDLVVLPHALELARDPHETLREVERVLVPEGRVVIVGFNPASLWGLRQRLGHLRQRLGLGGRLYLPSAGDFLGYGRVRDWLRLLGFEVERGRFGCWRLPLRSEAGLQRMAWIEAAGARGWPVLGAVYLVEAVKRVRGMRLVGLARRRQVATRAAPAVAANRSAWGTDADPGPAPAPRRHALAGEPLETE